MELKVGAATGAACGEKDPARRAQRNGYRDRSTRASTGARHRPGRSDDDMTRISKLRVLCTALAVAALPACTGGVNAGEKGGTAFILMTGMLLAIGVVLWLVLGRGE